MMYKLLRSGFEDFPTTRGPHGEVILNLARRELDRIDVVPQNVNVLILDNNYIRRLENLVNLTDLQQLSVASNKLYQMHGVANLLNLTILNLPKNAIVAIDGLAKLHKLRWLNLSANRLKSIDQLDGNVNLKHLDVSENYITQLSDISHLVRLKTLLLHCNRIHTLSNAERSLPRSLEIFSLASNSVTSLQDVQHLTSLPHLVQFSIQNNPCTAFPPDEYEPLVVAYLPKLDILNGIHVQHTTRMEAERLRATMQVAESSSNGNPSSMAFRPPGSYEVSHANPTLSMGYDLHSSSSELGAMHPSPGTLFSNGSSIEAHCEVANVVASSANASLANGPVIVRPDPPASEPIACHAAQMPVPNGHPFLSLFPGMSADDPPNEHDVKSSELQDHMIPASCSSPRGHTANSYQVAHQRFHPANNATTCNLLMSESVYVPVTSHLSVPLAAPSGRESTVLTPGSVPSSHSCHSSHTSLRATTATRPLHSSPPHSRLFLPDSLDPNTSQELESSRVTLVPECLRDTLQSSFSFIPLNRSVESEPPRIQPTSYRSASDVAQSVSGTKPPVSRLHLINSVHMITDDEDSDETGHRTPRDQSSPRTPRPRSYDYASPDSAPHVDSVNIDQLLSRSRLPPDETVARSLDSWIHAGHGFYPSNGLTDTYGMSSFRNSSGTRQMPIQLQSSPRRRPPSHTRGTSRSHTTPRSQVVRSQHNEQASSREATPTALANPPHNPSDSVCASTLTNGTCLSCGFRPQAFHDHIVFLRTQLQAQYQAAVAESELRQLHSKAIEFLLQEVQELKAWKANVTEQLSARTDASIHSDPISGSSANGLRRAPRTISAKGDVPRLLPNTTPVSPSSRSMHALTHASPQTVADSVSDENADAVLTFVQQEVIKVYASDEDDQAREIELTPSNISARHSNAEASISSPVNEMTHYSKDSSHATESQQIEKVEPDQKTDVGFDSTLDCSDATEKQSESGSAHEGDNRAVEHGVRCSDAEEGTSRPDSASSVEPDSLSERAKRPVVVAH